MLLNELFEKYILFYELILSKTTLRSDIATYNKHFKNGLGLKFVDAITFLDIQEFCNVLLKNGYKVKTVKNIVAKLRVIFKFALKLDLVIKNPCEFIELPRFDNKRYFDYSTKTQKAIIKAIVENRGVNADIFFFLLHGRRKNEVLSLKFSDINLKNRTYIIPYKINKAKRNMIYTMSDELYLRLLKHYIQAKKDNRLNGYIFENSNTHNKFVDLRRSWNSLLKRNNLPKIRLHDIRHLIGTYSINYLKLPIEQVSFTLGHTNIITTQKYITSNIKKSKETIENLIKSVN
ncbi:tyrosine-type recombinase/integrase [Campylobacter sp. RM9344]|uniref:Tyrosine-type recombinase/integrase n=1 Tax=Campylobacter californiensis TaxID=1032243 RepID=A0AAW3ZXE1_9BACT|nr:tyrosine-type recombinase/integrase [Campylobacter sp. RM6883]MBE2986009.1 tyrosine-type recombinase/integrase [Campylobacter sp. RM12919]MBE2988311.1 tyrosine-type recombinase/integrase [Campylobacter sp. RM12920]MBE2994897.1 tyrosine-type recombinase/integrase [Campylobacter sp. RM6913]MBE3029465.1 tyrosine-type recombinase/integrase [Campylobacter sp. RM9344]MBE3605547.1 tyrosine-type recombinase/integrase [Campylobacter sp. RM13119]MBE3608028.1 tyrosine-type recombinase/integrase [Camp